ncbi:hypothetical protein ACOB87_44115 [Streptomyces sp. YS-B37]|uniref:hypothetical protein n=1 Tax=Streptomyces sp. YS-B37 TaxID=3407669 RepID=UPI003B50EAD8
MLDERVEGLSYGGHAGAHLVPVAGAVHDVRFYKDAPGLGDELGVLAIHVQRRKRGSSGRPPPPCSTPGVEQTAQAIADRW